MSIKLHGETKIVPIKQVTTNPWNPNLMDDFMYEKIRASVRQYGQVEPIVVRQYKKGKVRYQVINGEHRFRAMKDEGSKKIMILDLGEVSDKKAKSLTVVLNELHGRADEIKLAQVIKDLEGSVFFDVLPFKPEELDGLLSFVDDKKVQEFLKGQTPEEEEEPDTEAEDWVSYSFKVPADQVDMVEEHLNRHRKHVKVKTPKAVRDGLALVRILRKGI